MRCRHGSMRRIGRPRSRTELSDGVRVPAVSPVPAASFPRYFPVSIAGRHGSSGGNEGDGISGSGTKANVRV